MGRTRALVPLLSVVALTAAAGLGLAQTPPEAPAPEAAPPAPAAQPAPVALPPADLSQLLPVESAPEDGVPADEVLAALEEPPEEKPPMKRARYEVAIVQALDKVTAETIRFAAPVGQPVRYKSLVFTVRACELAAPDEPAPDAIAYMTVESHPLARPGRPAPPPRQAFRGWMYASSPGLNPLEHPAYDAWLITCRAAAPDKAG